MMHATQRWTSGQAAESVRGRRRMVEAPDRDASCERRAPSGLAVPALFLVRGAIESQCAVLHSQAGQLLELCSCARKSLSVGQQTNRVARAGVSPPLSLARAVAGQAHLGCAPYTLSSNLERGERRFEQPGWG